MACNLANSRQAARQPAKTTPEASLPLTAVPGSARVCRREAKLTVSPNAVTPPSAPLCTSPNTAGPQFIPIRTWGCTPNSASISVPPALSRWRIANAARQARKGASSKATGAPKIAIMPSPVKLRTRPPCSWTAPSTSFERLCISRKVASSPCSCENVVEFTMSANRTAICRRSGSKRSPVHTFPQGGNTRPLATYNSVTVSTIAPFSLVSSIWNEKLSVLSRAAEVASIVEKMRCSINLSSESSRAVGPIRVLSSSGRLESFAEPDAALAARFVPPAIWQSSQTACAGDRSRGNGHTVLGRMMGDAGVEPN
jgi:hypothetical protein